MLSFLVCLGELRINDCQSQVEQEECPNEDQGQEVEKHAVVVGLLELLLHITPAFKSHRLEDAEERVQHIVEICNAKVWVFVGLSTEVAPWTVDTAAKRFFGHNDSCLNGDASVLQGSLEQIGATNREDGEEKEEDTDCVTEKRHGLEQGVHQNFKPLDA